MAEAASWAETAYRGGVHVVAGTDETSDVLDGTVFVDADQDSVQDPTERGLAG